MAKKTSGVDGPALTTELELGEYARSFATLYDQRDGPESAPAVKRYYGFKIVGWQFIVEQGWLAEFVAHPLCTPLPNAPSVCLGLVNVRGNIVPYYNITSLVSSTPTPDPTSLQGLLLSRGKDAVMLAIDGKPIGMDETQLHPASPLLKPETWLRGAMLGPEGVWHELNLEALFSSLAAAEPETESPVA